MVSKNIARKEKKGNRTMLPVPIGAKIIDKVGLCLACQTQKWIHFSNFLKTCFHYIMISSYFNSLFLLFSKNHVQFS